MTQAQAPVSGSGGQFLTTTAEAAEVFVRERDARGNFGPPTFADAVLDVPEAGLTITVRVQ